MLVSQEELANRNRFATPNSTARIILDVQRAFETFFQQQVSLQESDSALAAKMLQSSELDFIEIAATALTETIMSEGAYNGIAYEDIANLRRHGPIRELLGLPLGWQNPESNTPTIQWHANVLESQIANAITHYCGDRAMVEVKPRAEEDTILWQLITRLVIDIAEAITLFGAEFHIPPNFLMAFRIEEIRPRPSVQDTYLMILHGP